jgi:tetratricopeptide (TPR) repeat protein
MDYREAAKQRLADLYERRLFMELQFLNDADAAAEDFAALSKLISDETTTHPLDETQEEAAGNFSSAPDQLGKYWADESKRLGRLRADLLVAQGRLDEAIPQYLSLIDQGPRSTSVMAEVGDAFLKYKLALALTRRARGGDLAEAVGHLKHADKIFSRLAETDSKNSWWPLVCGWIERALGEAYTMQHDDVGAANAYNVAIERDRALLSMDPGKSQRTSSPRPGRGSCSRAP